MFSILSPHVAGESLGKCLKGNCHVNSSDIVRSFTILHNEQYITEFCICVSQDITCSLQKAAQYCPMSTCYNNCYILYRPSLKSLALCRGYITVTSRLCAEQKDPLWLLFHFNWPLLQPSQGHI